VRVIWLCEELGLEYEAVPVDFSAAYRASPEWRALSPVGKVPVLEDDALVIFESGAMVQYILDRYGEGRLQPAPGTHEHAVYLQWSWFAESTFARPLGEIVNHRRALPPEHQSEAALQEMRDRAALCLAAVDDAVRNRDYLLGAEFSGADVMMGYTLLLAQRLLSEPLPDAARAYYDRLSTRPGFVLAAEGSGWIS
jgi:glutathione S-transferase